MKVIRRNPFELNDLWKTEGMTPAADWAPVVDIVEDANHIVIKAELPGVEMKDITVSLDDGVLTIKGERRLEKELKEENIYRMERTYGMFSRSFVLPPFIDGADIKAEFKNGLLTVMLPKKEVIRPHGIEVKAA
jgi:HSP20 family protein